MAKIQFLSPNECVKLAKKLIEQKGFQQVSRSDTSFYFVKPGRGQRVRISDHKQTKSDLTADVCYHLTFLEPTINTDVEYQVKKATEFYFNRFVRRQLRKQQ